MNRLSQFLSENIGVELWIATLVAIALITIVLNQVAQVLLRHAAKATAKTDTVWDDALVQTASRPVLVAMWVVGFGFMARVLQRQSDEPFLDQLLAARDVALVLCVTWFVIRFIGKVGKGVADAHAARGDEADRTTIDALVKLGRLVTVIVTILIVAQTLGFQITGLLALGGVGGLAVGLAAKDLLANFFGGLTIYMDRPFSVGDWIRSPDKSIEGTVEYISWRHTRIRALNKNPVYVPNALFTSIVVENPTRMSHRRLRETIGVRYDDIAVVPAIVADIKALLTSHPDIDQSQAVIVNFTAFSSSSLDLLINAMSEVKAGPAFFDIKQDILLKIGAIVERHGAEFAFPTQTLHIASNARADEPGTA